MDDDLPLVSIIVCAYNAQAFIAETLQSLLAQTYRKIEIVVVDDGSTDNTRAVIQRWTPPIHYLYQANAGSSSARNTGIVASRGELICFFDSDDVMPPDRIGMQVEHLRQHPEVGLAVCDYRNFSRQGREDNTHFQTCPNLQTLLQNQPELILNDAGTAMALEHFGITGTMMVRRSLLTHVPGFEPSLRGCEDFYFYFQIARHTVVGVINRIGMERRMHAHNLSSDWATIFPASIRSYTLLRNSENNPETRKILNEKIAFYQAGLARHEANSGNPSKAIKSYFTAFLTAPSWRSLTQACHGFARTLMMALKLHKPLEH